MAANEFTDDEFAILDLVSEDAYVFCELRFVVDAPSILLAFLEKGLVEIEECESDGTERLLVLDRARAAITDAASWADSPDPPVSPIRWYQAFVTPAGWDAYDRAALERHPG